MTDEIRESLAKAHADRMVELDVEGLRELQAACREYHQSHSKGPGGAAVCVCGGGCGSSRACRGYGIIRDLFRYANFDSKEWIERFEFVRSVIN